MRLPILTHVRLPVIYSDSAPYESGKVSHKSALCSNMHQLSIKAPREWRVFGILKQESHSSQLSLLSLNMTVSLTQIYTCVYRRQQQNHHFDHSV